MWMNAADRCFHGLSKLFKSKNLSSSTIINLYKTLVHPVLTYGSVVWDTTEADENRLLIFERQVLRRIFGLLRERMVYRKRKDRDKNKDRKRKRYRYLSWDGSVEPAMCTECLTPRFQEGNDGRDSPSNESKTVWNKMARWCGSRCKEPAEYQELLDFCSIRQSRLEEAAQVLDSIAVFAPNLYIYVIWFEVPIIQHPTLKISKIPRVMLWRGLIFDTNIFALPRSSFDEYRQRVIG